LAPLLLALGPWETDAIAAARSLTSAISLHVVANRASLKAISPQTAVSYETVLLSPQDPSDVRSIGTSYRWNARSQASADDCTVVNPEGNKGAGRWVLLWHGPLDVRACGAVADGSSPASRPIQSAIDAVDAANGGEVFVPTGHYNLGTTGLVLRQNVRLVGEVERYQGKSPRGAVLEYSGSGSAIYGHDILNSAVEYLTIDASKSAGSAVHGIYFSGAWQSTIRHVVIVGVTPEKGYAIFVDTDSGKWGSQHNVIEQSNSADGILRLAGGGPSDQVTTTLVETYLALQYQVENASPTLINATAEGWKTGPGYSFNGSGTSTLVGCDIEGAGSPGIQIDSIHKVRETGTSWQGFSGKLRVAGSTDAVRSYGGAFQSIDQFIAGTPALVGVIGDDHAGNYTSDYVLPTRTFGGEQAGCHVWHNLFEGKDAVSEDFCDSFYITNKKQVSKSTATIFTIVIPKGDGLALRCNAHGTQSDNHAFIDTIEDVVRLDSGVVTEVHGNRLSSPPDAGQWSFVPSGSTLKVRYGTTAPQESKVSFGCAVNGPMPSYAAN
jgi:hypothetical protein